MKRSAKKFPKLFLAVCFSKTSIIIPSPISGELTFACGRQLHCTRKQELL